METDTAAGPASAGTTMLRAADRSASPWRNGTGSTSEILVRAGAADAATGEPDTATGRFDWRLSIATVSADGPFSTFPGVDRSLMALSAAGLGITDEGAAVWLGQYDVHDFPGENSVASTGVTGETLDLNLMCDRGRRRGTLGAESVSGMGTVAAADADEVAVVFLDGWLVCREHPGPWTTLGAHDAVLLAPGAGLQLVGRGRIAIARVRPA
ncbi:HutD family protein [Cryobacterium sp.]|jgi:environmental stress-induced protein Ves|uniref:HutD/Ves family protein n=1 Tax=Cryobacterium sp. TaxID=1926290 RepID=UPI002618ADAD|nr:HutD family protein [Cryobacterium sp.]MCU1447731.1 HutD family protein [Cryobacterium sp.]